MLSKPETLPGPLQLTCAKCTGEIKLHTHAQAKSCCCIKCGRLYHIDDGALVFKRDLPNKTQPQIAIGTTGLLDDVHWIVTGFTVKKETKYQYAWREYILFNPKYGYAYLTEADGHWIMAQSMNTYPTVQRGGIVEHNGAAFRLYSKYKCTVEYAQGEFPYEVTDDNKLQIEEYINPPELLCNEFESNGATWLTGWHIEPTEVAEAFKCQSLPPREGVGMVQPQSLSIDFTMVMRMTLVAVVGILALQFVFDRASMKQTVFTYHGIVNDSTSGKMIVSNPFELKGGRKNLSYQLEANVSNSWLETGVSLVNEKTNETFSFEYGVEYYSGYDGGESWSEGSTSAERIIESVPEGTYHLLITPIKNAKDKMTSYDIKLVRDVPRWSNLWKVLLILAIFPVIQFFRRQNFERNRWMGSDYSPYEE